MYDSRHSIVMDQSGNIKTWFQKRKEIADMNRIEVKMKAYRKRRKGIYYLYHSGTSDLEGTKKLFKSAGESRT